ncbi:MAG: hypothetical protein PHW41_09170, partial [Eubacteriales bacterium]|nr:hypothetical protein [Eubacteriales bacterium]
MSVRILVALLFVGFVLTTFFIRSSSALGRTYSAEVNEPTASAVLPVSDETTQPTDLPDETPLPEQSAVPTDLATSPTAEPTATEEGEQPTPTVSPDVPAVSEEPTEVRAAQFSCEVSGVRIRVNTTLAQSAETTLSLSLARIALGANAAAFDRYQDLLTGTVSPEQLNNYIAYELRYLVDGAAIDAPQSVADITLSDLAQQFAQDADSIRVFYLAGSTGDGAAQLRSTTARVENGVLSLSLPVCPMVLFVEQQQTIGETPLPELSPDPEASATPAEPTPDPAASISP